MHAQIDFVDERFEFLTIELDSIESRKKTFKEQNSLTDIGLDTEHNLSDKSNSNSGKVNLETQLEVARIIKKTFSVSNKNPPIVIFSTRIQCNFFFAQ